MDVGKLFEVAMGTYDLDLVVFVAERSQKDPKEFLPLLNELRKLPEPYRRFKIDISLKRFPAGLRHMAGWKEGMQEEEKREECVALVVAQRLYKDALVIFAGDEPLHKVSFFLLFLIAK